MQHAVTILMSQLNLFFYFFSGPLGDDPPRIPKSPTAPGVSSPNHGEEQLSTTSQGQTWHHRSRAQRPRERGESKQNAATPEPTLCWNNHGFLTRCSIARRPSSDWWQKNSKIFSTQPVIFQHMLLSLGFSKEPSSWIDQLHLPRTGFGTLRGCVGTLFTVLHRGCGIQSWWVHNCVTKAIACSEGLNHHKSIFAFGAGPPSTNTILGLEHVRWLVKWGTTVT